MKRIIGTYIGIDPSNGDIAWIGAGTRAQIDQFWAEREGRSVIVEIERREADLFNRVWGRQLRAAKRAKALER